MSTQTDLFTSLYVIYRTW